MISRVSVSSTCESTPSTESRSCTLPGGASNVTRCGSAFAAAVAAVVADAAAPPGAAPPPVPLDPITVAGTLPRKYGEPSGAIAISDTRAGSSRGRSPGAFGSGSQTKVTFVLPFSPREVPIHVRTTLARDGRATAAAIALLDRLGRPRLRRRQRARRILPR